MGKKTKFLNDQSEAELSQFLRSKIKNGQKVKINLDNILGVGGESLVAKILQDKDAFKIIPLDDENDENKNRIVEFQQKLNILKPDRKPGRISKLVSRLMGNEENSAESSTENSTENQSELVKESLDLLTGRSEYDCSSIKHENVINYQDITLDVVNDQPCLIVGKIFPLSQI